MGRYQLLLNRASGGNLRGVDAMDTGRMVAGVFREAGHELDFQLMEPAELGHALDRAIEARPDAIIAGGGDGTVSAAAQRLAGGTIALGILPMGTFNHAARDLGVPLDLEQAARFLSQAETVTVDMLDVAGRACLCATILGFYPEFAKSLERRDHGGRWWRKFLKLVIGLPKYFALARALRLEWKGDDGAGRARTKFCAFVPGRYKASTGIFPVRTDFQSGTLSAYIGTQRSARSAVRGLLDYAFGRQNENPELVHFTTKRLELRAAGRTRCRIMIDGEILRLRFPLVMEIRPACLRVLTTAAEIGEESGVSA